MLKDKPDRIEIQDIMTAEAVCSLLNIKRSTLYEWCHIGFIPHLKIGKGRRSPVLFVKSEIEKWMAQWYKEGRATRKPVVDIDNI